MKTKIVGIGYKARQGKNLLARTIRENIQEAELGVVVEIYSFATALKSFCRAIGWMKDKDPRILQLVGTDIMRSINENVWVDCLKYQIEEESPDIALIADMRFPNEFQFCKENGMAIKISRLNADGSQWVADDRDPNHPSEIALDNEDNFDFEFKVRDGDRRTMYRVAKAAAQEALKGFY